MQTTPEVPDRFCLIIGAMKAGTSSLFDYLASHPEVCASTVKETNYFSGDDYVPGDLSEYASLWEWDASRRKVAIEASVNYTKIPSRPNVAARLKCFDVDWRFIYLLRHPIERIESHLTHGQARSWNASCVDEHLLTCSMYAKQLDAYVEHFDLSRIRIIISERLFREKQQVLQGITDFMNLSSSIDPEKVGQIRNHWTKHKIDNRAIQYARKNPAAHRLGRLVPVAIRRRIRHLTGTQVRRISLPDDERERVLDILRPDLLRLRDVYGVDVSNEWKIEL